MNSTTFESEILTSELPEAVFLESLEGDILDVNKQACNLLGYSREELLEMDVDDLVPEAAPSFLPDRVDKATRTGEALETINVDKEGNPIPVEIRRSLIELDGRERILVSMRDITERKEREEQLELYEMAVEGSDDLMAACDQNYNYLFANQSYRSFYEIEDGDIGKYRVEGLIGSRKFNNIVKPRLDKCLEGERVEYEMTRTHPRGEERELKVIYYPLKVNNRIHGVVAVLRDVTEVESVKRELEEMNDRLRQSKKRYRRYFKELGDAVFITKVGGEDHGSILDANTAAEEQTGYSRAELIGMNIETELPAGDPEGLTCEECDERLVQGETVSFNEKKRRKDGSEYWTEVVVTLIEHEGEPATLSLNRDITERKTHQEKLKAIEELSQKLKLTESTDRLYDYALEHIEEAIGYGTYSICEKRDDTIKIVRIKGSYLPESKGRELPIDGKGLIPAACRKGEPIYVEDVTEDERYVEGTKSPGSEYVIPLQVEGELYGALDFENEKKSAFGESDRELMDILASQIAVSLQGIYRLNLYDDQREKLEKLHKSVDLLQREDEEEGILKTAIKVAEKMLDFELCAIATLEGDKLVPRANSTDIDPSDTKTFEVGEGITGKTIQEGETIWGNDLRNYPEAEPTSERFNAFISVPIGELGVLQVISEEMGHFTEEGVKLAEILAGHLREELLRVRLEKDLREQASHDPLTGLYNRRHFNETLNKEVKRCERYGHDLAFLMMDVNRFKEINDRYNHQLGDEVLEEVAELLLENVRDADTVVRYGGDEFLVMMPETGGVVDSTVDRLKNELESWNERTSLIDFPLTLAMGVSHWSPSQDRDAEEALKEADREMYEDKDR